MKIIALMMTYNEEFHIEQSIKNIWDFCDEIIAIDTFSQDNTRDILRQFECNKFRVIECPIENTHDIVDQYSGSDVWLFGCNGDELYDKHGLMKLRHKFVADKYNEFFRVYGVYLHVIEHDPETNLCKGYFGPPSHNPFKLYNMTHVKSWPSDGKHSLFLSQDITFKPEWERVDILPNRSPNSDHWQAARGWGGSLLRVLHMHFVRRTPADEESMVGCRLNMEDVLKYGNRHDRGECDEKNYRLRYKKGELHSINASEFFV